MVCHFSAICKVVALPVGKQLLPVDAVHRLRRRSRRRFSAEFRDSCAAAFSFCPLMRQKWAVRYFWPFSKIPAIGQVQRGDEKVDSIH
jgi:hypothetical protein